MKLKYYLRGLGIGIAVTAIVMGVPGKAHTEELTDAQIVARAKELGMIEQSILSDVLDSDAESKGQEKPVKEENTDSNDGKSDNSMSGNAVSDNSISDNSISNKKTAESQQEIQTESVQEQSTDSTEQKESDIMITVEKGESSLSICKKLEKAGLIDSASEFDQYLCQKGYDKKICAGEHYISSGATDQEIAEEIIAKN